MASRDQQIKAEMLQQIVDHRDKAREWAASLPEPFASSEKQKAEAVMRAKFEEFVQAFASSPARSE